MDGYSMLIEFFTPPYSPFEGCVIGRCTLYKCTFYSDVVMHIDKLYVHSVMFETRPIYVKWHVRNKDERLVGKGELLETNPAYAHVRLNGRCTTDGAGRTEYSSGGHSEYWSEAQIQTIQKKQNIGI